MWSSSPSSCSCSKGQGHTRVYVDPFPPRSQLYTTDSIVQAIYTSGSAESVYLTVCITACTRLHSDCGLIFPSLFGWNLELLSVTSTPELYSSEQRFVYFANVRICTSSSNWKSTNLNEKKVFVFQHCKSMTLQNKTHSYLAGWSLRCEILQFWQRFQSQHDLNIMYTRKNDTRSPDKTMNNQHPAAGWQAQCHPRVNDE